MQASRARCHLPIPACLSARLAPHLPSTLQRLQPGRRPPSAPFLRVWRRASPKRQLFMYFCSPPSREGYLPTSTAPPTGSPAGVSVTGRGNPGRDPLSCSCSNGCWPLSGDPGRPRHQLRLPTGTPPQTTAAPRRARYCAAHLQMLRYLTKNLWTHFHVGALQQREVREPSSPSQRCKEGELICRSQGQKCKPHHPIKRMNAS